VSLPFTVVIPTYERPGTLRRVLDALAAQRDAPEFEMVVVDDG
jgi:glycosyltransferase involved in cell wall biosynthesis